MSQENPVCHSTLRRDDECLHEVYDPMLPRKVSHGDVYQSVP